MSYIKQKLFDEWYGIMPGHEAEETFLIALMDILCQQQAALELCLAHENCGGTSCPKPMRAMCSNQMHKIVRKALAATDEALKRMGVE